MTQTVRIIVSGRVQGVYFRVYTQKQALKHNINGRVRNLADGTVEIIAQAESDALKQLIDWCHKGPLLAKVTHVNIEPMETLELEPGFVIT